MTAAVVKLDPTDPPLDLDFSAKYIRNIIASTTKNIIEIGRELKRVKAHLGHGRFLAWIEDELAMTDRSARNYMRAADWAEGKSEIVSVLPPSTIYKLAAPSTPKAFAEKIVEEIKQGLAVDPRAIEGRIREQHGTDTERAKRKARLAEARRQLSEEREADRHSAETCQRKYEEAAPILAKLSTEDIARLLAIYDLKRDASALGYLVYAILKSYLDRPDRQQTDDKV